MQKILIGLFVVVAVGGAYYLGTTSNPTSPQSQTSQLPQSPLIVDDLIVPTGLNMPERLVDVKIDEPTKVLMGEMKIPTGLLRTEPPPAQPDLVIPRLPTDPR